MSQPNHLPPSRPRKKQALVLTLAFALLALFASACGNEEEGHHSREGEPLELGDVSYNIQITRYLNPFSDEDSAYLEGAPDLQDDQQYLGVFMQITNDGDEAVSVPYPFKIEDTRGNMYRQIALGDNIWALTPGADIAPDQSFPAIESPAANGPIEGSLILFAVEPSANDNRPLQLIIPGETEGRIDLDI